MRDHGDGAGRIFAFDRFPNIGNPLFEFPERLSGQGADCDAGV